MRKISLLLLTVILISTTGCISSYVMDEKGDTTKIDNVPISIDVFCWRGGEYLKHYNGGIVKTGNTCLKEPTNAR